MIIEKDELSIYDVEELHKELKSAFESDDYAFDMVYVQKIDMSIIQLFVSAFKSAKEASKVFELQNVDDQVKKILKVSACEFLLGEANG